MKKKLTSIIIVAVLTISVLAISAEASSCKGGSWRRVGWVMVNSEYHTALLRLNCCKKHVHTKVSKQKIDMRKHGALSKGRTEKVRAGRHKTYYFCEKNCGYSKWVYTNCKNKKCKICR